MLPMKSNKSALKSVVCLVVTLFTAQMFIPALVPSAHALYWEDDIEFNSPQDRVERPSGKFFLFRWIDSIKGKNKERRAGNLENHDKGPGVNGKKKALLMITCGVVGVGTGLLLSSTLTDDNENRSRNNFLGAALGLCAGLALGSILTPKDYQVDSANLPQAEFRRVFAAGPEPRKAPEFRPMSVQVALKF